MTIRKHRQTVLLAMFLVCMTARFGNSADEKKSEKGTKAAATKKAANTKKKAADTKKATEQKAQPAKKAEVGPKPPTPPKPNKPPGKANPLQNLIKNIFAPKNKPVTVPKPKLPAALPGKADPNKPRRDRLDDRSPQVLSRSNQLRSIHKLIELKDWDQAVRALQKAIDEIERDSQQNKDPLRSVDNPIVRDPSGQLVTFRTETMRLIRELPPERLQSLREQHAGEAERLLEEAALTNEPRKYAEVAERFFYTNAGYVAANFLGSMHFDRQEFVLASRWFQELLDADAPISKDARWRLKAAVALREAGQTEQADALLSADGAVNGAPHIAEQPKDWLAKLDPLTSLTPPVLDDWPMLYGTATRTGISRGGEPLLLERWSHPTTLDRSVRERVDTLVQDLVEVDKAVIPAFYPLAVGGKAIFRTLRGVEVVDVDSGKSLWMTDPGVSAEILLSSRPARSTIYTRGIIRVARNRFGSSVNNGNADMNSVTSLLFRNGTFGLVSSDGHQLFVLEDHAILPSQQPGYSSNYSPERNDPYRRSWSSNKLTSYDLETGRPLWSVGGRALSESLGLPLAGAFFLGTPVADGGELFVVAEKNKEVLLYTLDAKTGQPKWAELLAYADNPIDRDLLRRWWPAQATVGGGVIVCPTTVGWLIAVDRLKRSVLWTYRYSKPSKSNQRVRRRSTRVGLSPLNTRWCASAPIIVGDRVVYTPSESTIETTPSTGALVCLNLFDGKRVWQKKKEKSLYLAGVFDGRVIVVGSESISALSLEKGITLWKTPIAKTDGRPSGRGVVVDGHYYLPLQSGQLWTISLKTGKVKGKIKVPEGQQSLGNLAMYRGKLLSLTPRRITAYEQRAVVESQIKERKAKDELDSWALLREADIHLLHLDFKHALTTLRRIKQDKISTELEGEYRRSLRTCLLEAIRSNTASGDAELRELESLASNDDERFDVQRLKTERLIATGKLDAAFELLIQLVEQKRKSLVSRSDDPNVKVTVDHWLAGQLADLWGKLPEDGKQAIDKRITLLSQGETFQSVDASERFAVLFAFHPTAITLIQEIIKARVESSDFTRAELMLLRLSQNRNAGVAVSALVKLAQLYDKHNLKADADQIYLQLAEESPDVVVTKGTTIRDLVAARKPGSFDGGTPNDRARTWGDGDVQVERIGTGYSSSYNSDLLVEKPNLPYYRQRRISYDLRGRRLNVANSADDKLLWTLQLRGHSRSGQGNAVTGRFIGHQLFLLHRDVLQCLSPVDRNVIWTRALDLRGRMPEYYVNASTERVPRMLTGTSFASSSALVNKSAARRRLVIVNSNYLCFRGRRTITVVDAMTGEIRWTANRISPQIRIIGTPETIYLAPRNSSAAYALRSIDGKRVEKRATTAKLGNVVHTSGDDLVIAELGTRILNIGGRALTVKQVDPATEKSKWELTLPANAFVSRISPRELAVLKLTGDLELVDLETGRARKIGAVDPKTDMRGKSQIYALSDDSNVYLTLNGSANVFYNSTAPSVRANGVVAAFERESGQLIWKDNVKGQNLLIEKFELMPWLVFSSYRYVRKDKLNYMETHLTVINKKTGRRMLDERKPASYSSQVRSVDLKMAERTIVLRANNEKIRLIATDNQTADAK